MARQDWYYPNIHMDVIKTVDKAIQKYKRHGEIKYEDRQQFINEAIHLLLDVEEGKKKIVSLEVAEAE